MRRMWAMIRECDNQDPPRAREFLYLGQDKTWYNLYYEYQGLMFDFDCVRCSGDSHGECWSQEEIDKAMAHEMKNIDEFADYLEEECEVVVQ